MIIGKAAFLVIDVQQGIMDTASKFYSPEGAEGVMRIKKLLGACREAGIPAVFFKEVHRPSMIDFGRELDGSEGVHALENSPRTEIAHALDVRPDDPVIPKRRYSGFLYTDLKVVLNGLGVNPGDTLILCGYLTDVCVHYTFVDAHQLDFRLKVVEDCCGASTDKAHEGALNAMHYLQRDARCNLERILQDIRKYASKQK